MSWLCVTWLLSGWLLWMIPQCACASSKLTALTKDLVEMKQTEKIKREILRKLGLTSPPTPERQSRGENPHTVITVLHGHRPQREATERQSVSLQDIISFSETPENITDSNVIQFRLSACTSGCRLVVKSAQMLVLVKTRRTRHAGRKRRSRKQRQRSGSTNPRARRALTAQDREFLSKDDQQLTPSDLARAESSGLETANGSSPSGLVTDAGAHVGEGGQDVASASLAEADQVQLSLSPDRGSATQQRSSPPGEGTLASTGAGKEVELLASRSSTVQTTRLATSSRLEDSPNETSLDHGHPTENGTSLDAERLSVRNTQDHKTTTTAATPATAQRGPRPKSEKQQRKKKQKRRRRRRRRKKRRRGKGKGRKIELVVSTVESSGQLGRPVAVVRSRIRGNRWLKVGLPKSMLQHLVDSAQRTLLLHVQCKGCTRSTKAVLVNARRSSSPTTRRRSVARSSAFRLNRKRPFLILHTYQERLTARSRRSAGGRHASNLCSNRRRRHKCCKQPARVDFAQIGWNDWILSPDGFDTAECQGRCSSGSDAGRESGAGNSTCVPVRKRPLRLVYLQTDGTLVSTTVPDIIVTRCGCRRLDRLQ